MHVMTEISENAFIERLARRLPRSPLQLNGLQETDAELVRIPAAGLVLAMTTDWIVEEIESGLYSDPYLIGWMTVAVNASDLAAVGAEPIGLLLNENLPPDTAPEFIERLQEGIRDASSASGLYVLGGDTNISTRLELGGSALGLISDGQPLTRLGCKQGDYLFATGPFGSGSGYAFVQFLARRQAPGLEFPYQPQPRLREGRLLRRFASACMDSSDGLIATLDQLMRLNGVGFVVDCGAERLMESHTLSLSRSAGVPAWTALAGPHGEFELVFTVPPQQVEPLLKEAAAGGWMPLQLGKVVERPAIQLSLDGEALTLDTGRIRNLFTECGGNAEKYFRRLMETEIHLVKGREEP